jgi:hypothetical protein
MRDETLPSPPITPFLTDLSIVFPAALSAELALLMIVFLVSRAALLTVLLTPLLTLRAILLTDTIINSPSNLRF